MKVFILKQYNLQGYAIVAPIKIFMYEQEAIKEMERLNSIKKWPDEFLIEPFKIVDGDEFNLISKHHFSIKDYQERHDKWQKHNFGGKHGSGYRPLLGVVEEVGELAHAHLKAEQGIRNNENHEANKKDAVADIIIYLSDYCTGQGIDLEQTLKETWDQVLRRDWKAKPDTAHEQGEGNVS